MRDDVALAVEYKLRIGGEDVESRSGRTFSSMNPATGEEWGSLSLADAQDVDRAVAAAREAFETSAWRDLSPTRRGRLMMRLAERVGEHAADLARVEVRDNGKLLKEATGQIQALPDWLYYYGGMADKIEGRVIPLDRTTSFNYTLREPLGVVGIIVPWNSPLLLTIFSLAPTLAAGNVAVIKPSEHAGASVVELARLFDEVGFPSGVINVVTGDGQTGEALVDHPHVAKICFTGSDMTGRMIASRAGARLARCTLELGGKSANIVFSDADLDAVEAGLLAGIFAAGGQTCIAGSRALIQSSVYDSVLDRLTRRAGAITLGDPLAETTQMGPIANSVQLNRIDSMVTAAVEAGATVAAGGSRGLVPELPNGLFYNPTILTGVSNESVIAQREVFGPVLTTIPFADEEAAIRAANDSPYGLAAGVWTRDIKRGHRVARRLATGTVWINLYRAVTFNSPFGGYKDSGSGRQNGIEAMDEFLQTKSVWCELSEEVQDPFVMRI